MARFVSGNQIHYEYGIHCIENADEKNRIGCRKLRYPWSENIFLQAWANNDGAVSSCRANTSALNGYREQQTTVGGVSRWQRQLKTSTTKAVVVRGGRILPTSNFRRKFI